MRVSMFRSWGIAATDGMPGVVLNSLTFYVIRYAWHYSWWLCASATGFFFLILTVQKAASLILLRAIGASGGSLVLALLIHYGTVQAGTSAILSALVMAAVVGALLFQAWDVARHGVMTTLRVTDQAQTVLPR